MINFELFLSVFIACSFEIFFIGLLATAIFDNKRRKISVSIKIGGFLILSLLNCAGFLFLFFTYGENASFLPGFIKGILLCFILPFVLCKIKISWVILCGTGIIIARALLDVAITTFVLIPQGLNMVDFEFLDLFIIIQFHIVYLILAFLFYKYILWIKQGSLKNIPLKLIPLLILSIITFSLYYNYSLFQTVGWKELMNEIPIEVNTLTLYFFLTLAAIIAFLQTRSIVQHREKEKELKTIEKQLAMQKEHISQMAQKQRQIQQMSHDFKHHVHTLQGLSNSEKLQEIKETVQKLSQQQLAGVKIVNTGNTMLDALLSIKREIAERENILCDWNIVIPSHLPIKELDTCAILGNALDNAIEACHKLINEKPFIKLDMYVESDWLLCSIKNPIGQPPKVVKGIFKTSKSEEELHGFGLQSMKQCCESMGGGMEIFHDEKLFTVRFMLPLNVN